MKCCPFFAQEIQDAAVRCKHCQASLEETKPPAKSATQGAQKAQALTALWTFEALPLGYTAFAALTAANSHVDGPKAALGAVSFGALAALMGVMIAKYGQNSSELRSVTRWRVGLAIVGAAAAGTAKLFIISRSRYPLWMVLCLAVLGVVPWWKLRTTVKNGYLYDSTKQRPDKPEGTWIGFGACFGVASIFAAACDFAAAKTQFDAAPQPMPSRSRRRWAVAARASTVGLALWALPSAVAFADAPAPLAAESRQLLAALPADPPPLRLIQNRHYITSNEQFPYRFQAAVAALGGVHIGVGSEQNYFYAGWSRPELMVLIDFDQIVVDVHHAYCALLADAPSPAELVNRWSPRAARSSAAIVAAAVADHPARARIVQSFLASQETVHARLWMLRHGFLQMGLATFLTDDAQYAHVRALARGGRLWALRGDMTGSRTMPAVAAATRRLGLPVRTVYLSNLEDYFGYAAGLGQNLRGLPTDDRSLILRTLTTPATSDEFRYLVQRMSDMRAWLDAGRHDRLSTIVAARPPQERDGARWLGGP